MPSDLVIMHRKNLERLNLIIKHIVSFVNVLLISGD